MEDRKISQMEEASYLTYNEISPSMFIPVIVNEGNGYVNKRLNLKDVLNLLKSTITTNGGGGSSGGGSSSGGGAIISDAEFDTIRTNISKLQTAVKDLQNTDNYPTHRILMINPNDTTTYIPRDLPCGYGASSTTVEIYSDQGAVPSLHTELSINQPTIRENSMNVSRGILTFPFNLKIEAKNGNVTYKGFPGVEVKVEMTITGMRSNGEGVILWHKYNFLTYSSGIAPGAEDIQPLQFTITSDNVLQGGDGYVPPDINFLIVEVFINNTRATSTSARVSVNTNSTVTVDGII